jgi:lipid II:glycine glycyltransferase (peptidoglycan interpeptide bridge formation enzyme)
MTLTVRVITREEHLAYIDRRPSVSFLQTPAWGDVKSAWRSESLGWFRPGTSEPVGAGLVLYRPVPRLPQRTLAYLPEGPDLDWLGQRHPDLQLSDWLDPMLAHLKARGSFSVKMGPSVDVRRWSAATIKEAIAGGGASRLRDLTADVEDRAALTLLARLRTHGWQQQTGDDAGFGDVQPRYVFQVPLAGRTEADLLKGFNQLWRRNIKKADKAGVTVELGTIEDLRAFHEVYVETAERDRFRPRPLDYFVQMMAAMTTEDPDRMRLYLARHEGRLLASTTMVTVGTHVWYSYGASSNAGREVRPSNAIQWRMMRDALAEGAAVYDLRGISDTLDPGDPLFGLIQFKVGTGGEAVELAGEWDYPLRPLWHKAFQVYLGSRG